MARTPSSVPVKNRTRPTPRSAVKKSASVKPKNSVFAGFKAVQIAGLVVALILILLMVAIPMRNYFQQRGEITKLTADVAAKKEKKQQLIDELEKYRSDDYIKEQARIRLGVVEPGETAFRIIAPIPPEVPEGPTTPDGTPTDELGPWWAVMWDSIARPDTAPLLPEEDVPADTPIAGQPPTDGNPQPTDGVPAPVIPPGHGVKVPGLGGKSVPEAPQPPENQPAPQPAP